MRFRHLNGAQIHFMRELREAGAVTPDAPLTIDRNAPISPAELEELIEVEAISRVAPYRYHLRPESRYAKILAAMDPAADTTTVEPPANAPRSPAKVVKTIVFWILVMLIPIVMLQLFKSR